MVIFSGAKLFTNPFNNQENIADYPGRNFYGRSVVKVNTNSDSDCSMRKSKTSIQKNENKKSMFAS